MNFLNPELITQELLPSYLVAESYVFSVDSVIIAKQILLQHLIDNELALSYSAFPDCQVAFALFEGCQQIIPPIYCRLQHDATVSESEVVYEIDQTFKLPILVSALLPTHYLKFYITVAGYSTVGNQFLYQSIVQENICRLQQGIVVASNFITLNLFKNEIPIYYMEQDYQLLPATQGLRVKVPKINVSEQEIEQFCNMDFERHNTTAKLLEYQKQRFTSQVMKFNQLETTMTSLIEQTEDTVPLLPQLDVIDRTSKCDILEVLQEMWKPSNSKDTLDQLPNIMKGLNMQQQQRYVDGEIFVPQSNRLDLMDQQTLPEKIAAFLEGKDIVNPLQNNLDYLATMPIINFKNQFKNLQKFRLDEKQLIPDPQEKQDLDRIIARDLPPVYFYSDSSYEMFYKYRYFIRQTYARSFRFLVDSAIFMENSQNVPIDYPFFEEVFQPSISDCLLMLSDSYKSYYQLRAIAIYQLNKKAKPLLLTDYLMQLSLCVIYDSPGKELSKFLLDLAVKYEYEFSQLHFYLKLWAEVQKEKGNIEQEQKLLELDQLYFDMIADSPFQVELARSIEFVNQIILLIKTVKEEEPLDRKRQRDLLELNLQNADLYPLVVDPDQPVMFPFVMDKQKLPIFVVGCLKDCYVFKSAKKPFLIRLKLEANHIDKKRQHLNMANFMAEATNTEQQMSTTMDPKDEDEPSLNESINGSTPSIIAASTLRFQATQFVSPSSLGSMTTMQPQTIPQYKEVETQNRTNIGIIFKFDDDVRNDVMVLQLFAIMERKIRDQGMNLDPTHYAAFAFSPRVGMVECVEDVTSIDDIILEKSVGTIERYFYARAAQANPAASPQQLDRLVQSQKFKFTKSVSLYSILTYILAVGDRHMENILLTPSGKMFHIDFGWLFARDPKPKPALMKISGEMVLAMGGIESKLFQQFLGFITNSYKVIRKNADIICVLLLMLQDSGIKVVEEDIRTTPSFNWLLDRLKLTMDDDEATISMTQLVQQQLSALFPKIIDALHRWIQQRRQ